MPSVDVIRNITIKGKADGVDDATAALNRLTDSIKAANENLAKSSAAANDNTSGFRITREGAATAANHLRQAVAAGIVTATNLAGTGVVRLGTAIETTFPAFSVLSGSLKTAGAAMEAFSPT